MPRTSPRENSTHLGKCGGHRKTCHRIIHHIHHGVCSVHQFALFRTAVCFPHRFQAEYIASLPERAGQRRSFLRIAEASIPGKSPQISPRHDIITTHGRYLPSPDSGPEPRDPRVFLFWWVRHVVSTLVTGLLFHVPHVPPEYGRIRTVTPYCSWLLFGRSPGGSCCASSSIGSSELCRV